MEIQTLQLLKLLQLIPDRKQSSHKGDYGHVLVIAGDVGMSGAARMAGEAALRVGAGLVSVATHPSHAHLLNLTRPELMVHGVENREQLLPLIEKASVIALGPGLGQSAWSKELFDILPTLEKPVVVDADALNLLSKRYDISAKDNWILTPHPGEAAELLHKSIEDVQEDRCAAIQCLQQRYHGIIVLKGAGTLVCGGHQVFQSRMGNPGMATAGMGDVLTGIIAGLVAQDIDLLLAAQLGVALHAKAGDLAIKEGMRSLLAMDLMPYLRQLIQ